MRLFPAPRPFSVVEGRDPFVLSTMLDFYAEKGAPVLDATANWRKMWDGVVWDGLRVFADIDRDVRPQVVADFSLMPFAADSFGVIVFDPPHLPPAASSQRSKRQLVRDYGLAWSEADVSACFAPFLAEAHRVLRQEGLIFAKLKDFVHNHRYHWTLTDFVAAVRAQDGLTPCDLIVKHDPSGGMLNSSQWDKQHHVRNAHSWWVVVRKGACERR